MDNLTNVSFNDIINFINIAKEFIRTEYNITHKIECNAHIPNFTNNNTKKVSLDDTSYISSIHLLFNVILFDVKSIKQLIINFIATKKTDWAYWFNVYSYNKKFRKLFQSEEKITEEKNQAGKYN